ncbi:uncharacterized protein LOC126892168 [Diabrotica virgifera virgifera]|uniref:CCHC-type domain-containing protein n=1 Tax=Diabrotica virgifera virgifera TaxID=50390 RepID=A0ABM5L580_DIAVI|nr:uncharacterized protein LOC126892168 [Diabrotica virgifera virgifera]
MDIKEKHRKVLRTTFSKAAKELEDLLKDQKGEVRQIKISLDLLRQKMDDLRRIDEEIYDLLLNEDASEQDLLKEIEDSDSYIRKFADLSTQFEERVQPRIAASVEDEVASGTTGKSTGSLQGKRKFKLPMLEFKKYDGNIKSWLPFWSQFQKIHHDSDIDLSDKVEYLVQATVPGSRARQLVDSFPATGDNYTKIIDCLISRFGRDDLQIEVYVRELLKLVINNTSSGNKLDISLLYDRLETQLRALETLGIKSDKYAAMLFPLVESCLPADLLRIWQRFPEDVGSQTSINSAGISTIENRLKSLMQFLKNEVDNEQHVSLAIEGFGVSGTKSGNSKRNGPKKRMPEEEEPQFPSAMGLVNSHSTNHRCVFCENAHESSQCFKAQKLTYDQRVNILTEKGACFRCLKIGHQSRRCRGQLSCLLCHKPHVPLMCREFSMGKAKKEEENKIENDVQAVPKINQSLANSATTNVFLQTLRVKMNHLGKTRVVRALIDTGSQKTYILRSTARLLDYPCKRQINLVHGLFGGSELAQKHDCYDVNLSYNNYSCTFEALDQPVICSDISSVFNGPWMEELKRLNIEITDSGDTSPIEVLIGADIAGKLYTGRRHILGCGLVAVETLLGWTLMGKIPLDQQDNRTATTVSLFISNASISQLWELDALGINDPAERKTREETALAAKQLFFETVATDSTGRYETRLPWLEGHPALPSNYQMAKKRLDTTLKKINKDGYLEAYGQIFKEWLDENIIEEVFEDQPNRGHYLPHRPVIKPNSASTKIRPVFDASAKEKDKPSLNQCLEKGVNLIELIPAILLRFRRQEIGVISDIRKAFLQIGIHKADRDFLRFLWIDDAGKEKVYRHCRVVFGISSSPFLLGASLEHHFSLMLTRCASKLLNVSEDTILKLSHSFYVDNCVTSVANEQELRIFVEESNIIMAEGKFDLRGWEYTGQPPDDTIDASTQVLGIKWNKIDDTLCLRQEDEDTDLPLEKPITKRVIVSQAQRLFEPLLESKW